MNEQDALHELRRKRLRRMVALCGRAHPFYKRRFAEANLIPEAVKELDDLQKIPLTKKEDFMAAPEDFSLDPAWLPELPFEERTMWNVAYTTGTTSGRPSPFLQHYARPVPHHAPGEGLQRSRRVSGAATSSRTSTRSRPCPWAGFCAACARRKSWVCP